VLSAEHLHDVGLNPGGGCFEALEHRLEIHPKVRSLEAGSTSLV
jgi:hypothetical protein